MLSYRPKALQAGKAFSRIVIQHTQFREALDYITNAILLGNDAGIFAGVRLIAPSGAGKSLLLSQVENSLTTLYPSAGSLPFISASLKESPTVSQIQNDLLANFNYSLKFSRADNSEVRAVLVNAVRERRVKAIAIDEFQHVFLSTGDRVVAPIIDWLKRLMNLTGVPVLLAGTQLLEGLETIDPQFTSRIPTVIRLHAFKFDREWGGFLKALADNYREVKLESIYKSLAKKIFDATAGVPRALAALLTQAVILTVDREQEEITESLLHDAYLFWRGPNSIEGNPFAISG